MARRRTLEELREELWHIGDNLSRVMDYDLTAAEVVNELEVYITTMEKFRDEVKNSGNASTPAS
jgi:hypothetical protein